MTPRRGRAFGPRRWALLLLLALVAAPAWDLFLPAGPFPPHQRRTVVIERGQSLQSIARELQRSGVIRGAFGFLALARVMRLDRGIKAGQYSFRLGITVPALLRALGRGMYGLDLTRIPEGLTLREVRDRVAASVGFSPQVFDSLAHDPVFLDSLGIRAPSAEGYLAPDSYEWLPGTSPEVVLRTMATRTLERLQAVTAGCDSLPLGLDLHQILTLASVVECEAQVADERPRIARVYLNRLQIGMRLQADPTVAYAHGMPPRSRLYLRHLTLDSPYNTYVRPGLPPGPICSPGLASLEAVMQATPPGRERDLYFVARGDGRHFFAGTFAQHQANILAARALQAALRAEAAAADSLTVAADSAAAASAASGPAEPAPPR